MTISLATNSTVFLGYVIITAALLVLAGLLLGLLRRSGRDVASPLRTYRGWLVMIPIVLVTLFLGREATIAGVTALPTFVIALILLVPVLRNRAQGELQKVALAIFGFIYFGWMFMHLGFLANTPNAYGYLLFLVFAVEINDVAAFTFGKMFGKRKLREHISPNKTLAGSIGAITVSMLLPWLLWFSFPLLSPALLILSGLIVGIGGQLGDLVISYIKRDIGIKDMGTTIHGHGGILDRVDSMIFVAPIFFHMVRWFGGAG